MFRGSDPINMDAKGRMAIPTRYRDLLSQLCGGDLVITIDMKSTCLTLSPLPEWKKFEEKVAALPAPRHNDRLDRAQTSACRALLYC